MMIGKRSGWTDPTHIHYPRALILMAIGAVSGLALAAFGLFTAEGTSTLVVPAEDVALVNQQPIMRSDYLAQLRASYDTGFKQATQEQRRKTLDDMIREELFVQRGSELDVASADPAVRASMVSAVEQQIAMDSMTQLPNDEKLRDYYLMHKDRYSLDGYMVLRDLVFPRTTPAGNLAQARRLTPDQAIGKIGARDSGKVSESEFYFAAEIHLGHRLASIAEAMPDGSVSEPIDVSDGIHIFYMARNVKPELLAFANARAKILEDYRQDLSQKMLIHAQEFLRKRANILIAKDLQ